MEPESSKRLQKITQQLDNLSAVDALAFLAASNPGQVTFSTSFSYEDQVITHLINESALPISFFTLDTGRLFAETYSVWSATLTRYAIPIRAYFPKENLLDEFVAQHGPNAFYESVENRKGCCYIRKVEPLKRALQGNKIWITGLRAEHSVSRQDLPMLEWDEANQLIKYHPLLHWTTDEIKAFIEENNIPYNPLHNKGFVSIGCAPCTRAIKPGEDFRAGRWWWEESSKKECGLHEKKYS